MENDTAFQQLCDCGAVLAERVPDDIFWSVASCSIAVDRSFLARILRYTMKKDADFEHRDIAGAELVANLESLMQCWQTFAQIAPDEIFGDVASIITANSTTLSGFLRCCISRPRSHVFQGPRGSILTETHPSSVQQSNSDQTPGHPMEGDPLRHLRPLSSAPPGALSAIAATDPAARAGGRGNLKAAATG
jgi:hypothetical protein